MLVPIGVARLSVPHRVLTLIGVAAILIALPKTMLLLGSIWLMGVAVFVLNRHVTLGRAAYTAIAVSSAAAMAVALWAARTGGSGLGSDLLVGAAFSALLASLVKNELTDGFAVVIFRRVAGFSYTLYLTHFPLAAFLACWLLENRRLEPSPRAFVIFAAAIVALLLYAFGISLAFERNTGAAQDYLVRVFKGGKAAAKQGI